MLPNRIDPEVEQLILKLSKGHREIEAEDSGFYHKIAKAEKVGKFVWWIIAGLVAVTAWIIGVQGRLTEIRKELDDRKPDIQHVREMWFMKEHGIPNQTPSHP